MGLLTEKGQQRYALALGKRFIAACDRKSCRRLIPVGELFTVTKWEPRDDGLLFLGARPARILCKDCQSELHPIPKVEKSKVKVNKPLIRAVMKLLSKGSFSMDIKMLSYKLGRRKKFAKLSTVELRKTLKYLKKDKSLQVKDGMWSVRK